LSFDAVLTGAGRFDSVTLPGAYGAFNSKTASVLIYMANANGNTYGDTLSGAPNFIFVSDPGCASGQRLDSTLEGPLENAGPTELFISYCVTS